MELGVWHAFVSLFFFHYFNFILRQRKNVLANLREGLRTDFAAQSSQQIVFINLFLLMSEQGLRYVRL